MNEYICFSGGASGSDLKWENECIKRGIKVVAFSFKGHKNNSSNTYILSQDKLDESDPHLIETNKILKRRYPTSSRFVNNLLRRDYLQMKYSDSIYAVSIIEKNIVQGGTGWCVHMGILNNKPVFVFDQEKNLWFTWKDNTFIECVEPKITYNFAGIGSRDLNEKGKIAIESIMINNFD